MIEMRAALRDDLFSVFPKVVEHGVYSLDYRNDYNLDFRIGLCDFPRLTFSKYGTNRQLRPYFGPTNAQRVPFHLVRRLAHTFMSFDYERDNPYEATRTSGFDKYTIIYLDRDAMLRYQVDMYHPNGWCIDVDSIRDKNMLYSEYLRKE